MVSKSREPQLAGDGLVRLEGMTALDEVLVGRRGFQIGRHDGCRAEAIEDHRIDQSEHQQLAIGDLTVLKPLPLLVQDEHFPPVRRQLRGELLE